MDGHEKMIRWVFKFGSRDAYKAYIASFLIWMSKYLGKIDGMLWDCCKLGVFQQLINLLQVNLKLI